MREHDDEWYPESSRVEPLFEQSGDVQEFETEDEVPQYPQGTRLVAERFFWRHVANDLPPIPHSEEVIDAIAELISYGGDLDEIMRKMALM